MGFGVFRSLERSAEFRSDRFDLAVASGVCRGIDDEVGSFKSNQLQSACRQFLKLRHAHGLHAEVESENACWSGHRQVGSVGGLGF